MATRNLDTNRRLEEMERREKERGGQVGSRRVFGDLLTDLEARAAEDDKAQEVELQRQAKIAERKRLQQMEENKKR